MNKVVAVLVVVIVLAGGAYALTRHKNPPASSSSTSSNAMNMDTSSSKSDSSKPVATNVVNIVNFAFSPTSITVKKGTTVTWVNKDSTAHTITETDSQKGPSSASVAPGESYSFSFNAAGTFQYYCSIHPSMKGTVTVTE